MQMHDEHRVDPTGSRERKIAVALSGGGHRACLFALGVLLYLIDAGRSKEVVSIASASGGSLANGAVAQSLDFTTTTARELESVVERVARQITGLGTVFGAPLAKAYVLLLVIATPTALAGPWLLPLGFGLQIVVFLLAILGLAWLAGLRGRVCARAFATTLFTVDDCPDRLDSICAKLDHVFCATDLHGGKHVYFSQDEVRSFHLGPGKPGDIKLSTVIQASAAFPGAFPISWQPTARHKFAHPKPEAVGAKRMALVDGGVYDNMADQWARVKRPPWVDDIPRLRDATELIVVSSSAGLEWKRLTRLRLPVIGELLTLLRDKDVLYNNGNSLRRQELVSLFKRSERDGEGLRGALVHITQSPLKVAGEWKQDKGTKGERARRTLAVFGATEKKEDPATKRWKEVADANKKVKTTLLPLDPAVASRLLHHGYALAMANLHVHLDYPLLDFPAADRFHRLVGDEPSH
jgi:predicted acylesterase/phospholipase RssA